MRTFKEFTSRVDEAAGDPEDLHISDLSPAKRAKLQKIIKVFKKEPIRIRAHSIFDEIPEKPGTYNAKIVVWFGPLGFRVHYGQSVEKAKLAALTKCDFILAEFQDRNTVITL